MTRKTKAVGRAEKPRTTKKAQLIRMLSTKSGAEIGTISDKLGWQCHTTRAAITGVRKAGYEVTVEKAEGGKTTRYRITAKPAQEGIKSAVTEAVETVDAGES